MIELRIWIQGDSPGLPRWALNPVTGVLKRASQRILSEAGKKATRSHSRDWAEGSGPSPGLQQPPEERHKFSSRVCRASVAPLACDTDFRILASRIVRKYVSMVLTAKFVVLTHLDYDNLTILSTYTKSFKVK